ncbi:antitoxin [Streptomyces aureus]|uniref:antitoxin n=1 Tax=Streptomyces aureus TaxID=193461 RepID=UPI000567DC06|nr:antitoxin [Streptomyces aureus]
MGIFDKFKHNKAAQDKAADMSDAAEKQVNQRTGDKYTDKVDEAQQKAEGAMGMDRNRDRPPQS